MEPAMRSILAVPFVCLLLASSVPVSAQAPPYYWSRAVGGATSDEVSTGLAVDASGAVLLGGHLGNADLAKFSPNGTPQWSHAFPVTGTNAVEKVLDVAVDGAGGVLVTGYFHGSIDFGGGPLASVGPADIFLAKFDGNGQHQWSKSFGSQQQRDCYGERVAVDAAGNVVVTGQSEGDVDFGGGLLAGTGHLNIFLAKYDANGLHQWSYIFAGGGDCEPYALALDAAGNPVVAGGFQGTINFGGSNLASVSLSDIFVAKFNAAGVHQWSNRYGTAGGFGYGVPYDLGVDGTGHVVMVGEFTDPIDFGGGALTSAGSKDIFIVRLNAAGGHVWSQGFGSSDDDKALGVSVLADGSSVVTGYFSGTVGPLVSAGSHDVFLAKFDANGANQWAERFGAGGFDEGLRVAVDTFGGVVATGTFNNTVSFGGASLVAGGGLDVFLAKYTSQPTAVSGPPKNDALSISSYPNPFNPNTTVCYTVPARGHVTVSVYDVHGTHVATLFNGERGAGVYSVDWDGRTGDAAVAASGVYFARVEDASGTRSKKMVLLK
jgi:hypothetical protein